MKTLKIILLLSLLLGILPIGSHAQSDSPPLYVALVWHQHQPVYFKEDGVYQRPWVRVHAAKDYLDMVTILEDYPEIHATYNFTPSLMLQLDDFLNGAKDQYWVLSEIPAEDLTPEQKTFILQRFFDINAQIIARFPRYQELADLRIGASEEQIAAALEAWQAQDFRDLQVLFNLAWTDPDFLAEEPLASLVAKERDFAEEDKAIIFAEHLRIISEIIPAHKALQDAGQIEVITTPFAHPILPLLVDSNIAGVAMPEADLPARFVFGQDAVEQVNLAIQMYTEKFGVPPRGMWPAEGSVSPNIVQMIANAGIQWIATDEDVLARSLPDLEDFTRNSEDTVQQSDELYRPYTVAGRRGGEVSIIFRDHIISDKVGFEYSQSDGQAAADDLMQRLNNIQAELQAEGATGPNLVTILLDGENAWEYYPNDGKDFFHALYRELSEAENIQTVTPSEFLAMTEPPRPLDELWPGSWITPDFSTWIGEEEENLGWSYLLRMREDVQKAMNELDPETLAEVMRLVYVAEGSDWFWWYGADQNSGVDRDFDAQFRGYLAQIYQTMGQDVPNYVNVPIIAQAIEPPTREASGAVAITVNGEVSADEWAKATYYALENEDISGLAYGFDAENLYLLLESSGGFPSDLTFDLYLRTPDNTEANAFPRYNDQALIGFGARQLVEITPQGATVYIADGAGDWTATETVFDAPQIGDQALELALPLATLAPNARTGDSINLRLTANQESTFYGIYPVNGAASATLPDQAIENVVLEIADPEHDDFGLGTYEYPKDGVFRPGVFDATSFVVGYDAENVIFQMEILGPFVNDWGSPNGMGILAVDVYVDMDGPENGARILLPGRNTALSPDFGWDFAIFAEGWESAVYKPAEDGGIALVTNTALQVTTNPTERRLTIRVPRSIMEGEPSDWAFLATVASQDGFPSAGVLRIRNVEPEVEQWRIGGGTGALNATRLLDVVLPSAEAENQAELLSHYADAEGKKLDELTPDDFAQLPMIRVE